MARLVRDGADWVLRDDFYETLFETVDLTDGSWTLLDPDGGIDTVTFADGFNTVTWNAFGASSNHNWNSSGNMTSPRWYKLLKIDGNQVTTGTHFNMIMRLERDSVSNEFNQVYLIGPAIDPTSTVDTTILGCGAQYLKNTGANQQMGCWTVNNATRAGSASLVSAKVTTNWGGDAMGCLTVTLFDSNNEALNANQRNSSRNSSLVGNTTTNVYVMVGVGPSGNTVSIAAGKKQIFKMGYIALSTEF